MVDIERQRIAPTARGAGQVSTAGSQSLARAGQAAQGAANTFTEFYEEEARIENDLLFATAQSDWSQRIDESKKSAGAGYAGNMLEQYDAYVSEVLANSPERGRDNLKLGFDKYRLNIRERALSIEASARAAAKARAQAEAAQQRSLMLARSDETVLAYDEIIASNPDLSEKERDHLFGVAFDKLITTGDQWALDRAREFIDGGRGDHLTGDQYVSLERSIGTAQSRLETKAAAAVRVAEGAFNDWANDRIAHAQETGRVPASEELDAAIGSIGLPAEEASELRSDTDRELRQAATFYDIALMPKDDLESLIATTQEKADRPDGAAESIDYRNDLIAAVAARQNAIAQDPAGYLMRNDSALASLLDKAAGVEDEGASPVLHSRAKAYMDSMYDSLGVPPQQRTYLTAGQAASLANQIESNASGQSGLVLRQIREDYGDMAPTVMAQLRQAGVSELTMEKLRHAGDPEVTGWLDLVTGRKKSDFKLPTGTTENDVTAAVVDASSEYYKASIAAGGVAAQAMMQDKFDILETVVRMMVDRGSDPSDAATLAFSKMFPEEVANSGRVLAILPVGTPPSVTTAAEFELDNIESEEFFIDTGLPDLVNQAVTDAALRSNGVWVNNSTGDGLILAVTDGVFSNFVVNEKGQYIERKFEDLANAPTNPPEPPEPPEPPKSEGPRISPKDPTQSPF